ncbi:MAG: transporter substrate-binding domain-containing protein [Lentisphaeria bacterium]|nr:transporter substrate-binding domain-containing protein [Lentisphaeria bacterium]MBR3506282.1 transporter substrate-binding domain-containing protein [Lentisphaeria bacterium]
MNKIFRLFAVLLLGVALLPACSKSGNKGKPLIVACEASTSPYCYYTGREASPVAGIDVDLMELIGKELGRPVQYKIVPFQQIFSLVSMGKADIGMAGITITPQRAERVLFSSVYDVSSQVIVVPKGSSLTDETSLKTARVAAQEGTSDLTLLRERIKPRIVLPFLTQEEVNAALIDRRADAAVMDRMQAELLVRATGDVFKILEKPLTKDQYGLLFNKKDTELAEAANTVIEKFKVAGTLQKSKTKHLNALSGLPTGAQTKEEIKPFIVCVETSFAPFVFVDNNRIVGVDIELAEAIAAELKRPLEIRVVPFTEVIPLVMTGAADMGASGISITPERSAMVLFSKSYEDGVRRILVNDDATFEKLEDLLGKVIGAQKGTTNEDFAVNQLHARETYHYDTATLGILGLLNHEIDAYVDDEGEADLAAGKYIGRVKMLNIAIPAEQYGFVFQSGNAEAKAAADKVIDEKRANGELQALFRRYNTRYKAVESNGI